MRYEDYVRIVDEVRDFAKMIIMNFAGETLLNPEIGRIVGYSESCGIRTVIGTNGTIDKSDELIDAGVSEILWALDGATKETYHKYRNYKNNVSFDDVLGNLRILCDKKRRKGRAKPLVILQFVVMKDNEHELNAIVRLGREIGVDAVDIKPVCLNEFFPISIEEMIRAYLPRDKRYVNYRLDRGLMLLKKPLICSFVFHETEILFNGDVTICCYDYDGKCVVGNVFRDGGFRKIWRSTEFKRMRRQILRQEPEICRTCGYSLEQTTRIFPSSPPLG